LFTSDLPTPPVSRQQNLRKPGKRIPFDRHG
jgi:hypothetical protein